MDLILLGFASGVFIAYVTYIWLKFGILPSISDSSYKTNSPFLFAIFIWGTAIPLMIVGNTALMFLSGSSLAFVGASPWFRKLSEGKVHVAGVMISIISGAISMWIDFGLWYLTVIIVVSYVITLLIKMKYETWWAEIMYFIIIIIGLFLNKIC